MPMVKSRSPVGLNEAHDTLYESTSRTTGFFIERTSHRADSPANDAVTRY